MNERPLPARDMLALLTGAEAPALLQLALTGTDQAYLAEFTCEVTSVHHRPGADTSVRYDVRYRPVTLPAASAPAALPDDVERQIAEAPLVEDHLVLSTGRAARGGAGVVELQHEDVRVAAWRYPGDPMLPAMAASFHADTVRGWLGRAAAPEGVDEAQAGESQAGESQPSAFSAEVVGHRPLRRATVRVGIDGDEFYVKTVRASDAEALIRRHRVAAAAGVGPGIVAVPAPGTIVLRRADGTTLARAIADAHDGRPAPSPAQFIELLDRLPAEALDLPRRTPWSERLDFHATAASETHPELAERLAILRRRVATLLASAPTGPVVPTHGDPYVANVFVDGALPWSLIDLDGLGPGFRVDDLATALAHLAVLPALAPGSYAHVDALTEAWHAAFESQPNIDAVALRARVAAVLVSLIAGATSEQAHARLELAESWCAAAAAADLEVARPRTSIATQKGTRDLRAAVRRRDPITVPTREQIQFTGPIRTTAAARGRRRRPTTTTRRTA